MKRHFLLLLLLLFPIYVYAEECDSNAITFESINLEEVNGNAMEKTEANIKNNKIELDIKLYDPGDALEYNIKIKNDTKNDYYFDEKNLKKETEYLEYTFNYEDDSNLVKANTSKNVNLRINYREKVPEELLTNSSLVNTSSFKFDLSPKEEEPSTTTPVEEKEDVIIPDTDTTSKLFIVVLFILCITFIILMKEKNSKMLILILGLISIYPLCVKAACKMEITVEAKVEIDGKEAYFLTGSEVNIKMKKLAGTDATAASTLDENVTKIVHSDSEPGSDNKEEKNVVSTADSPYPIYMWYEDGIIYWWSEDLTPNVNEDAKGMFRNYKNLEDIEGVESFDTSNTTTMHTMFAGTTTNPTHIKSLKPLSKWNTSNVTDLSGTFQANVALDTLEGLENWDTSKVTSLNRTFFGQLAMPMNLTNIDAIKNWNVSNVKDMTAMFQASRKLKSVKAFANWDTSNVENLSGVFSNWSSLETLDGLENWNTSKVTTMASLFHNCNHLVDATAIKDWDVSNVIQMNNMFNVSSDMTEQSYGLLKNLDISNWDMGKVRVFAWFLTSQPYVVTEFTITNPSVVQHQGMLSNTAFTNSGGHVVINYTSETEELVEKMIASKYANTSIEKGKLVEK